MFGNADLGRLISRVQSAVISSGSELERIIMAKVEAVRNLELFLKNQLLPEGVFIVSKRQIRKCDSIRLRKITDQGLPAIHNQW